MATKTFILLLACGINLACSSPVIKYHESRQAGSGFTCQKITIPIKLNQTASKNYTIDNYDVDFFYEVQNFRVFRTATYNTKAIYCAPQNAELAKDTIQLLNHGATFKKEMWDFPYEPETYSWVRAMHAAGYPTLAWDAIGCGESDHPDGLFEVQTQGIVESNRYLASLLKSGRIGGIAYKNVAYVGFSIGSVAGVSLAAQYPSAVEAIILHGYSWNVKNLYPGYLAGLQAPVNTLEKPQWKNISSLYQSQSTPEARQAVVFYGDFDPKIVAVDFELRDMDALGLALSFGYHLVAAPQYKGPVFLGDGNQDSSFCDQECGSQPYAAYDNFPLASDIDVHVYNLSGHGVHMHRCAKQLQSDTIKFLERNRL
ncbi:MAG: hypothetical protein LQ338_006359 [Usnochroma carphineum]|nr:MAG: hypothetical protein LQ338_006359 [Usnochroma carphineum]